MERYELISGTSKKFWSIGRKGSAVTTRWGRIGSEGRAKTVTLATVAEARALQAKLVREKTAKGYARADAAGAAAAKRASTARRQSGTEGTAKQRTTTGSTPTERRRTPHVAKSAELSPRKRLRAAFAELNTLGIVALERAGYTQSDGWDDVNERAGELADRGQRPRGGAFYHGQDVERGKRGEGLFITFGAYATGKRHVPESLAVAETIVSVLQRHGFCPQWNGSTDTRIHTGEFEWR